jgi:hypothetical protein
VTWLGYEALWWLPTVAVALVGALGLVALAAERGLSSRRYWAGGLLLVTVVAVAGSGWQQRSARGVLTAETDRLQTLGSRLDELGKMLPGGAAKDSGETFQTVATAIRALTSKTKDLETQIELLKQKNRERIILADTATKVADYLRGFGSRAVVVSCAPDDVEAYDYANQIANVLRRAGWDATGPEKTTIFGEAAGMGVRLYVRNNGMPTPDTGKLLVDAFTRFNIPIESGVAASEAIPDQATTELFVSHKP